MIYRIKEKFWSWTDQFAITDVNEKPCFYVEGTAFSWGSKLSFQDVQRNELAFINQELFSWKPRYQIIRDGRVFAEVVKEWSWFKKEFTLDIPGPNDYSIEGSFWQHEFVFTRDDRTVAIVSRDLWQWAHSYGVEIVDGEDDVSILCACIVIDQVLHKDQSS